MHQTTSTSFWSGTAHRTARIVAQSGLVVSSLLVGALVFGGCGDGDGGGTCNHCCTCNCGTTAPCSDSEIIQSDTCVDCDKDCSNLCIAASCPYVSGASCDDDSVCPCSCTCVNCPNGSTENTGAYCSGTCTSCASPCRDACMALSCTAVDFYTPEPCE